MKEKVISNKKILKFSLAFYLLLLFGELFINIFSFIFRYSSEKLTSSLFDKVKECLSFLSLDIVIYFLTLLFIYISFSIINYEFSIRLYEFLKDRINLRPIAKIHFFIGINFIFISTCYLINSIPVSYTHLTLPTKA